MLVYIYISRGKATSRCYSKVYVYLVQWGTCFKKGRYAYKRKVKNSYIFSSFISIKENLIYEI